VSVCELCGAGGCVSGHWLSGAFNCATNRTDVYTPVRGRVTDFLPEKSQLQIRGCLNNPHTLQLQLFGGLQSCCHGFWPPASRCNKKSQHKQISSSAMHHLQRVRAHGRVATPEWNRGVGRVICRRASCRESLAAVVAPVVLVSHHARVSYLRMTDFGGVRTVRTDAHVQTRRNIVSCSCAAVGASETVPGADVHTSCG